MRIAIAGAIDRNIHEAFQDAVGRLTAAGSHTTQTSIGGHSELDRRGEPPGRSAGNGPQPGPPTAATIAGTGPEQKGR